MATTQNAEPMRPWQAQTQLQGTPGLCKSCETEAFQSSTLTLVGVSSSLGGVSSWKHCAVVEFRDFEESRSSSMRNLRLISCPAVVPCNKTSCEQRVGIRAVPVSDAGGGLDPRGPALAEVAAFELGASEADSVRMLFRFYMVFSSFCYFTSSHPDNQACGGQRGFKLRLGNGSESSLGG